MLRRRLSFQLILFLSNAAFLASLCTAVASSRLLLADSPSSDGSVPPHDALALLAFKAKADLKNNLLFSSNSSLHFCDWEGVKCEQQRVDRLILENQNLTGVFASDTLTRLDQLRVLSLQFNSLTGPIPDLSGLINLKSLFLDHNSFTGSFPPSILSLHRLLTIDISHNTLTGNLPASLATIEHLNYLRLEWNHFSGTVPPFNQSSLQTFNVSGNNLTGPIPATTTLVRFGQSSFSWNPHLCGEIVHIECHPGQPFFSVLATTPPPHTAVSQREKVHGVELAHEPFERKYKKTAVIVGFSAGGLGLIVSVICFLIAVKKGRTKKGSSAPVVPSEDEAATAEAAVVMQIEQEKELEEKVKRVQGQVGKSGRLMFCAGEAQLYTLDQLMGASAELLGKGNMGTTYKAILDNRLIVTVKRLDASKLSGTSQQMFERHMESVVGLRHPNLVPLRAYFPAKEERLLVYDYQPNGSLFALIHGSKSTRAKPLHWTSCLKIAEDIAQGLSYIHQAWRLVHGNLKSTNVLLGTDFEACVTDYCLSVLVKPSSDNEKGPTPYQAPETRNLHHEATPKSDVYSFGILLLELLTGKHPSQHPSLEPSDTVNWVRSIREGYGEEDNRMEMLLEVAINCSLTSPEQRPTMWQVLKMLQEIKETILMEDSGSDL